MSCKINEKPQIGLIAERLKILDRYFRNSFDHEPEFYVRAPGRVNLIGEHIDYCGYAVFPMAIKQDILMAVSSRNDSKISITNIDSNYENFECNINDYEIDKIAPRWYKYILCGVQGVKEDGALPTSLGGVSLAISGTIPPGAGLSSSSALVCAATLSLARLGRSSLTLRNIASVCARTEKYIGTEGGGMDQAALLLSDAGSAQLIEFNPLRCTATQLPIGATFVVANSLVRKDKAASHEYNSRVVECRLASRIIAKHNGIVNKNMQLGELQRTLKKTISEMVGFVKEYLHPEPYSKKELCQLLDMSVNQLEEEILSANTRHLLEFELYKRALHVFTEASRVWEFKSICDHWNSKTEASNPHTNGSQEGNAKVLQQLGVLMQESHNSLQQLYDCSHPKLDQLVELSKGIAYGARLTGAGWGGCIVALVSANRVDEYISTIKEKYFKENGHVISDWSSVLFSTEPSEGASYLSNVTCNGNSSAE